MSTGSAPTPRWQVRAEESVVVRRNAAHARTRDRAGHVATVCDRNYVQVVDEEGVPIRPPRPPRPGRPSPPRQRGRYLVPSPLGLALIEGIESVDEALVLPRIRAEMEAEVLTVAQGERTKEEVLERNIDFFKRRSVRGWARERGLGTARTPRSLDALL